MNRVSPPSRLRLTSGTETHRASSLSIGCAVRKRQSWPISLRHLIGAYPVWDKDIEVFRPARASDIALLAPTGNSVVDL